MIFNFGSISDLYNKIKLLTTRVTNTEAVDVTQNNKILAIETVNTDQNVRLTNIESKLISTNKDLNRYITLNSGYTFDNGSYIRMYGNVVEMYLVINGYFNDTSRVVGKINEIKPYSSGDIVEFLIYVGFTNLFTTLSINTSNGNMSVTMPRSYSTDKIKAHMTYLT